MKYLTGKRDNYNWIETGVSDFCLSDLINKCSDLLIGKYLGIVYFDSGPFKPSQEEESRGWFQQGEIAYSPILTVEELSGPICDNYDQWCLYMEPFRIGEMTDFVNYGGFSLRDRRVELKEAHETHDIVGLEKQISHFEEVQEKFWGEIRKHTPHTFISDGDMFIYLSRNKKEIDRIEKELVSQSLKKHSYPNG